MKLTGIEKMESCIAGDFVYRYFFDESWKKEDIKKIAGLLSFSEKPAELKYYDKFPRPLFEIKCPDGTVLKGVESAAEFRVIYRRNSSNAERENFYKRCIDIVGTL
jgi:hypothetical protein